MNAKANSRDGQENAGRRMSSASLRMLNPSAQSGRPDGGGIMEWPDLRELFITEFDLKRLKELLVSANCWNARDKEHLKGLKAALDRATIVPPESVSPDVITMNSKVLLTNCDTGESTVWCLVFPRDADVDRRKVSILAPIGAAIIGCRVGDVVELEVPSGKTRLKIEAVLFQPEAAGCYSL